MHHHPRRLGPRLQQAAQHFIFRKRSGLALWLLLWPLFVLSLLYRLGVALRDLLPVEPVRIPCQVIAVGNLTVGGSGKTPIVGWLAQHLFRCGYRVSVVGHGYRGDAGPIVVYDGHQILAERERCGDEALMLAHQLAGTPIPLVAGHRRAESAILAHRRFNPDIILLDGGFQHRELHKDREILVINGRNPWGTGYLLPFGPLREPIDGARRADVLWVNKWRYERPPDYLHTLSPQALAVCTDYRIAGFRRALGSELLDTDAFRGRRAIAFAGIADPESFESILQDAGIQLVVTRWYPDHHLYCAADIAELQQLLALHDVDLAITTEKDLARLPELAAAAALVIELIPPEALDELTRRVVS